MRFIIWLICFVAFCLLFASTNKKHLDSDICLDTGYCAYGLSLNVDGKQIVINKTSCIKNNGIWQENKKLCIFKD